jgi:hypothetical protein
MIPLVIYDDVLWVSYPEVFDELGFWTHINGFVAKAQELSRWATPANVAARRAKIRSMRNTHFTRAAVMRHIFGWMQGGEGASDLRCAPTGPPKPR